MAWRVENYSASPRLSIRSSRRGSGYTPSFLIAFILRWSTQNRHLPPGFGASTTGRGPLRYRWLDNSEVQHNFVLDELSCFRPGSIRLRVRMACPRLCRIFTRPSSGPHIPLNSAAISRTLHCCATVRCSSEMSSNPGGPSWGALSSASGFCSSESGISSSTPSEVIAHTW